MNTSGDSRASADTHKQTSQFALLKERRFAPFFVTQLLGAFNDNLYKNALVALLSFGAMQLSAEKAGQLIAFSAGLFILPFFLFSAFSGQIADKYEKSMLMRRIKLAEIIIMCLGAIAFYLGNVTMLMGILFLMGVQSTFFGPIKYGILPQHLHETELIGGNGVVELGTFLAILLGTILGTQIIIKAPNGSVALASVAIVVVAICGFLASRQIPPAPPADPNVKVRFNPISETWKLVSYTAKNRIIFQSILGISWFWFMGATYLAQFPIYARDVLGGNGDVYTLLLAAFSIGIGAGSVLCERLSGGKVEIGLVPLGALGITLFGLDLFFATPASPFGTGLTISEFIASNGAWRIILDVVLIGLFGGFYIVPLYALIQKTSAPDRLSRAISCNNVMNALFMVLSAVLVALLVSFGLSIASTFAAVAVMNALVAAYIFRLVPEFLMRFMIWMLIHTLYRVRNKNLDKIPETGAAILACNHVSFIDALLVGGSVRRPVRFVMYYKIFNIPGLNFIFRTAKAIPIAGQKEDKAMYDAAFVHMQGAIENEELLCIFPEGAITHDGHMQPFRNGIMKLIETTPAPVIPVGIHGLWGSMFSRKDGRAILKMPKRLFARIGMVVRVPIPASNVNLQSLETEVARLRDLGTTENN
jgi:1-acyl-sn-glycerol-3-phosphate acyltransferase